MGILSPAAGKFLPPPIRTPLLGSGGFWVKPESRQHGGSVKYRLVYARVRSALEQGLLQDDSVLAEVSSGSTGVALAYAGERLNLRVEVHAPTTVPRDKRDRILRFGADLVLHDPETPISELLELVRRPGRWHLGQYDRGLVVPAWADLASEVVGQIRAKGGEPPRAFACAVGTGGLVQAVGSVLRREFPGIRVVSVEPEAGAAIDGMRNTDEAWLGAADPYDRSFPDARLTAPRPSGPAELADERLGMSSTAVLEAVRRAGLTEVLLVAAD